MIYALLPAAGKSVRMGQPKLGLRLGDRTVLETVVASLRAADTGPILVVLGPHLAELASLAGRAGAEVLLLPAQTPDMRATVEQGLRWLEERFHPRPPRKLWLFGNGNPKFIAAFNYGLRWTDRVFRHSRRRACDSNTPKRLGVRRVPPRIPESERPGSVVRRPA